MTARNVRIGYSLGQPKFGPRVRVSIDGREYHNFVLDKERGTVSLGDDKTPAWVVALRARDRQNQLVKACHEH
jgi:hypothetical protein